MKIYSVPLVLCFILSIPSVSSQSEGSCVGRCGQGYVRSDPCHCDYNCMSFMECCSDYKKVCTTEGSCRGRCHEGFIRGQTCDCDPGCYRFGRCCSDYKDNCLQTTQRPQTTPSSQNRPSRDEREDPPELPKKPEDQVPEDVPEDPNKTPKDKDNKPKKPKDGDDDPETRPKEPTPDDNDRNPKNPRGRGDDPDDPNSPPKEPTPDDKDKNPKKPGDDTDDPDVDPKGPKPKDKKKPKATSSLEVEENMEEHSEASSANNEDNRSQSNQRSTRKRSPGRKKTRRPGDDTDDDPPEDPSPDRRKKPNAKIPDNKRRKPTDEDEDAPNSRNPDDDDDDGDGNPRKPKNPKEREDDEPEGRGKPPKKPSQTGKGKNPKKKPNPKGISKIKKKVDSEEERQETLESEFQSSSQSSSSHSRSKTTSRRLSGKNKKNLTDKKKKKFPEDPPEEPLMPPKRKNGKGSPPTPEPTFPDEGSGDDGSGMDFGTTLSPTTLMVNSTTTASPTTMDKKPTEETLTPSKSPTENPSDKAKPTTSSILPTKEGPEKTTNAEASTQIPTAENKTPGKSTPTDTPLEQSKDIKPTTAMNDLQASDTITHSTVAENIKDATTVPSQDDGSKTTVGKDPTSSANPTILMKMTTAEAIDASTVKTPQDQRTTDSSGKTPTTVSGKLQETTNMPSYDSETVEPTKQRLPYTDADATTPKNEHEKNKETTTKKDAPVITETTTRKSDHTRPPKTTPKEPSAEMTTEPSIYPTTRQPEDEFEVPRSTRKPRPSPTKRVVIKTTTKPTGRGDRETSTKPGRPTKKPKPGDFLTSTPIEPEDADDTKTTKPSTTDQHRICDLLKDEAIKLRISEDDLQHIIDICTEMQQHDPLVSTPSPDVMQPNVGDRNIPPNYPNVIPPNQQPGVRIIQIVEEIYRRMNGSPMTNLTGVHTYTIHEPSKWLLLLNKIKSANEPQKNLCVGQPADGMTTLQNGTMVVFRGPFFWMLNHGGVMGSPRSITDVWGIPSPIDTVFTRCNCGGKTFFFKGGRYWRFTNDVMDQGYPKEIIKGFGGLSGKVTAVLPVAGYRARPESVYFFKPSGTVQKYTFRQEQTKRCTKKKRPSVEYPVYTQRVQTVRYRFPRDVVRHRIQIHRAYTSVQQPLGFLHQASTVSQTWRGVPNNIVSAVSLPNYAKADGFDYYVFSKDKYYNINMSSKVAVKPPAGAEQKTTKDWYKCKE